MEFGKQVISLTVTSTPYFFNSVASTTPILRTFRLLRWMQYLHHSALINNGIREVSMADVTMETKACG
jgi:hypothetical protein